MYRYETLGLATSYYLISKMASSWYDLPDLLDNIDSRPFSMAIYQCELYTVEVKNDLNWASLIERSKEKAESPEISAK